MKNPIEEQKTGEEYHPSEIESRWQKKWEEDKVYSPDLDNAKKPFYNLMMFPYPSAGGLHVGNVYAFTGSDIYGRFKRMQGYDVLQPIGLDGFGIHSENYALKIGEHPMEQSKITEQNFYRQLRSIGNGFDWTRTLETYDPRYYKWTQWIFILLFKNGLAYRKKSPVNWCPDCKTVLSDEQVIDGNCERCSNLVEKKDLEQWFFRITKYADRLDKNIDSLKWSEKVKISQKQWIGKKDGINIIYPVVYGNGKAPNNGKNSLSVTVFTTRPDTNFGATFVVIGPEHELVTLMLDSSNEIVISRNIRDEINSYVEIGKNKTEMERMVDGRIKTGVFTGLYAFNNLNDAKLPIWISDFVIGDVGTGAVVGVPGHDVRDFQFATTFGIPIIRVVVGKDGDTSEITNENNVQEKEGTMINSKFLDDMETSEASNKMMDYLEEKKWGKRITSYHLRDWLISRQRYWGPPIPMIYCSNCASLGKSWFTVNGLKKNEDNSSMIGWHPVLDDKLPIELPHIEDYKPLGTGKSPLESHPEFYNTICPYCRKEAKRETDVSDTFLDSSWYFFRYLFTEFDNVPFGSEIFEQESQLSNKSYVLKEKAGNAAKRIRNWLPVAQYVGGSEHSVLHLLYSRFISMVFKDNGLCSNFEEPFSNFFAHGLIIKDGAKMSKSKGNVVIPDIYIQKYGADTLRTYLMFIGPFSDGGDFFDSGLEGIYRFLKRVWVLIEKSSTASMGVTATRVMRHKTIKKVTNDLSNFRYNTAISALMEYYNFLVKQERLDREDYLVFLKLLAPFAPHLTEELWQNMHMQSASIHKQAWPTYNDSLLVDDELTIVVQVNGKLRDSFIIESDKAMNKNEVENVARSLDRIQQYLNDDNQKIIFVPGKIINFVTN